MLALAPTYKESLHKVATDAERAEKQLAKVEGFLAAAFYDAVAAARNAISLTDLERVIAEAGAGGLLKSAELPEIAWNEAQSQDLAILGQPYEIVRVNVAKFDALWKRDGAQYSGDIPEITEQVAQVARQGVLLPPPVVVDLSGKGHWAFMSGRNRYLYTRAAGHETLPLAVPQRDIKRLGTVAVGSPAAASGRGAVPAGALSRPYADLSDAIAYVGAELGNRFFSAVMAAAMVAGEREGVRLARMIAAARKAQAAVDFDTPNFGAVNELRTNSMNLIREMSAEQRESILQSLRFGVERGINPTAMAREFRSTIGLTRLQQQHVAAYRDALTRAHESAAARSNALGRALRDGRFDASVARAAREGKALTQAQIDKMVARYQERYIVMRAETIARTEALTAVHMGERAVWEEAVRRGDISAAEVEETWNTARDERVRGSHRTMERQKRRMGVPFTSGAGASLRFPGDPAAPAADRIKCRCVLTRNLTAEPIVDTPAAAVDAEGNPLPSDMTLVGEARLGGNRGKQIWKDGAGQEYLFKPMKAGDEYIVEAEIAGSKISRVVTPEAPEVFGITLDGKYGSAQRLLKTSGNLGEVALDRLTRAELAALQREHVVDWLISNHDGHAEQFIRTMGKDGRLLGIDKAHAFKFLGKDKLALDYAPHAAEPIYNALWRRYQADANFRKFIDLDTSFSAINKLAKLSDDAYRSILEPYARARFGDNARKAELFMQVALDRKHALAVDYRRFLLSLGNIEEVAAVSNAVGNDFVREMADRRLKETGLTGTLSRKEMMSIVDYTELSYAEMNRQLRGGPLRIGGKLQWETWNQAGRDANLLDQALSRLPAYKGKAYRGINMNFMDIEEYLEGFKPGGFVNFRSFTSSSKSDIYGKSSSVRFVINSKTGRDISALSSKPHEQEVLFRTGSRFIIRDVKRNRHGHLASNYVTIYLDEVADVAL